MEKSYVDKLDARKLLNLSLFNTLFEFLMDHNGPKQNTFLPDLSLTLSQYLIACCLMTVSQEVKESSVVVQELEFAINRALCCLL